MGLSKTNGSNKMYKSCDRSAVGMARSNEAFWSTTLALLLMFDYLEVNWDPT